MEIRQLRYFLNAARTLNFTEAAALSCISQSTLSQQIKQLEQSVGVPLFDRIGKRVFLTNGGKAFIPYAEKIVQDAEDGRQHLKDLEGLVEGSLRIGVTYGLSPLLTRMLIGFCRQHPKVGIQIVYRRADELLQLIRCHEIDLALTFNLLEPDEQIEQQPLFNTRLLVAVAQSHPLAKQRSVDPSVLRRYPLVLPSKGVNARQQLDDFLAQCDISIEPQVEINEIYTMLHLVKTGHWISVVAESLIYEQDGIAAIPFCDSSIPMSATLIRLKGSYQRNAEKAFLDYLPDRTKR